MGSGYVVSDELTPIIDLLRDYRPDTAAPVIETDAVALLDKIRANEDWSPPDDEQRSAVDRRYLQLSATLVDATKLDQLPKADPLIEEVLFRDTLAWLGGKPGHAKTFIALDMACCVATGYPWRGYPVTAGNVLYILAEGAHGMHERRLAWEHVNGREVPASTMIFLPVAVQLGREGVDVEALIQLTQDLDPVLVIIDTQARVTVGADENSSKDMGLFIDKLERLRIATGACLLIVHHEPRGAENLRGSGALDGAATTVMRATKDGLIVRLDCPKQKDAPEFASIIGKMEQVTLPGLSSLAWSHGPVRPSDLTSESESHLLATLRDSFETSGASSTTLRDVSGLTKPTFYRALKALLTKGLIVNTGTKARTCYVLAGYQEQL
jgi:hypothetical protein